MAAHDDKISTNRRNLFKALSAAPVVATLSPGAALASQSSLQCAAKLRADFNLNPGPLASPAVGAPFEYVQLTYWVLTEEDRLQIGGVNSPKVDMDGITNLPEDLPLTVVSMDTTNNPSGGPFYELDGSNFADRFALPARFEVLGNVMTLYNNNGNSGRLALESNGTTGWFAQIIQTGPNPPCTEDCAIANTGIFPQMQLTDGTQYAPAGAPQGISATCLGSFVDALNNSGVSGG